jgi:hypothetical protein
MRLFSNVPLILLLVITWPLLLLGLVVACEWLEQRTLAPKVIVPRRWRRMRRAPPEKIEQMVSRETADVVARYWASTWDTSPNGRPAGRSRQAPGGQRQPPDGGQRQSPDGGQRQVPDGGRRPAAANGRTRTPATARPTVPANGHPQVPADGQARRFTARPR